MADICVTIARSDLAGVVEEMRSAAEAGARMMELRLDYLTEEPDFDAILKRRTCPLIATFRRPIDGGVWQGPEESRRRLINNAAEAGFDFIDVEGDVARELPRVGSARRIVSHHDMKAMPADLPGLHAFLRLGDADVVKIAGRATTSLDGLHMLRLMASAKVPTIALCMGEFGTASRVLGAKFGAPFTYGALHAGKLVAPGILTFQQLDSLYRYGSINADTEVFGVIGDPIAQSLSPLVHNAGFAELGLNKVYVPFRVPAAELHDFIRLAKQIGVLGLSVTIPHKHDILTHGDPGDDLVRQTLAANTLVGTAGAWKLYNTDGPAALAAIVSALPSDVGFGQRSLPGRTALILGAGGAACTIAHSLADAGAIVKIASRRMDRAEALAKSANCSAISWNEIGRQPVDILVNATPVGMFPKVDECPIEEKAITAGSIVFDTIYNPEETQLLQAARRRNCRIVTGLEMFVRQAEAQFRHFTQQSPPAGLMDRLVRQALAAKREEEKRKAEEFSSKI